LEKLSYFQEALQRLMAAMAPNHPEDHRPAPFLEAAGAMYSLVGNFTIRKYNENRLNKPKLRGRI
jgi:hypothetical protein